MKKVMISQPMAGKTDEEIIAIRDKAIANLTSKGYEIVNTLFTDEWYSKEKMEEREESSRFHFASLQKALKICQNVTPRISVKVGNRQGAAKLSMTQLLLMA